MASPTIEKGYIFGASDLVTNTKLHNLVDLADWIITNQATGDICYFNGTDWVRLAKGTAGQILVMNAGVTAPEWANPLFVNLPVWPATQTLTLTLHAPAITV